MIEISSDKLPGLLPEFSSVGPSLQYAHIADHLKIMNSRMVLLNPKFVKNNGGGNPSGNTSIEH